MNSYRAHLPQLGDKIFLTDGGMETTLIFHDGVDLPYFAAFDLLKTQAGEDLVRKYFCRYAAIARKHGVGCVLESPTWRASSHWGTQLGYSDTALDAINRQAIELLQRVREEYASEYSPMVISGCIGPCDDGYDPAHFMTVDEAEVYHGPQIETFAGTEADMVSALTMTYSDEAIGIGRAAQKNAIPVVISFTVETDGRLPSGESLQQAIERVDEATENGPAYYMINCAHPTHFQQALETGESWVRRIKGIRANASCKSHAELDESTDLDEGDPRELGEQYRELKLGMQHINVVGGCCGTDHRHVEQICQATLAA